MPLVSTGAITLIDVNDGLNARLTSDSAQVSTLADGTGGVYTGCVTTMQVFQGAAEDSSNWAFTVAYAGGLTGSLAANTLTISGLTGDAGYADITATRVGYPSLTCRYTVVKSKQGELGPTIALLPGGPGFTFVDGVATPASQTISFTLVRKDTSLPVTFYASDGVTLSTDSTRGLLLNYLAGVPSTGAGDTAYLDVSTFGTRSQVTVTAVVGDLSTSYTVARLDRSTAEAGATRNVSRGNWANGENYAKGDMVLYGGYGWVCLVAHQSSGIVTPPTYPTTSNTYWQLTAYKGADAVTAALTASSYVVKVNQDGTLTPSSIAFTAIGQNQTGSATFTVTSGTATLTGSGDTRTMAASSLATETATVQITWNGITDSITVVKVREGTNAISIVVSNEAHVLPAETGGNVTSYTGSGTTVQVYEGSTALTASASLTTAAFRLGTVTQSPASTITVGATSYAGTTATIAQHSAMAAGTDTVTLTIPVTVYRSDGTSVVINKNQTVSKAKQGAVGNTGPTGATGAAGVRGTITTSAATAGTAWVDSQADAAISAAGGSAPLTGDIVTLFNSSVGFSQTRVRSSGGTWTTLTAIFGGDVIVNGTVATSKLIVTDTTNMVDDWSLEYGGGSWENSAKAYIATITSPRLGGSKGFVVSGNGTIQDLRYAFVDTKPGDEWYAECWIRKETATTTGTIGLYATVTLDGASPGYPTFQSLAVSSLTQGVWTKVSGTIVVPAGANRLILRPSVRNDVTSGTFTFDDFALRRRNEGSLIVDGSISSDKLSAGSVIAGKIAAAAVGANEIAAGVITASKLVVGTLNGNLVPNSQAIEGVTSWQQIEGTGGTLAQNTSWYSAGRTGFNLTKASTSVTTAYGCAAFPVKPGKTYGVRVVGGASASSGGGLYHRINYAASLPVSGYIDSGNRTSYTDLLGNGAVTTGPTEYVYSWTCPAGVFWASFAYYSWTGAATTVYFSEVEVREQNTGVFIGDGVITGTKVAASTITGTNIAGSTITGTNIAADTITAGNIAAAAITTSELAAGAVTASKIAVGDFANLLQNSDLRSGNLDGWTRLTASGGSSVTAAFGTNWPSAYGLLLFRATGNSAELSIVNGNSSFDDTNMTEGIYVAPGDQLHFEAYVWTPDTSTLTGVDVVMRTNSTTITNMTPNALTNCSNSGNLMVSNAASGFRKISGFFTNDSGAQGKAYFRFWHASTAQQNKGVYFFAPVVRRRNAGELIVDGSITATKINVVNLGAISATVGLLRTATSGARMEIESNQIRVYDSSNVMRMRMGIW